MSKAQTIGMGAFASCKSLVSITSLNSVTKIGTRAFSDCTALKTVGDLRNVTSIGTNAFYNCPYVTLRVLRNSYAARYAQNNVISYTYIQ